MVPGHEREPRGPGRGGNEGVRGAQRPSGVFAEETRVPLGDLICEAETVVLREERQDSSTFGCGEPALLEEFLADKWNVVASVLRVIEETFRMGKTFQVINEDVSVNQEGSPWRR